MKLGWYLRRAMSMSPQEIVGRLRDTGIKTSWRKLQVSRTEDDVIPSLSSTRRFEGKLPESGSLAVPAEARTALVDAAEGVLAGKWRTFAIERDDFGEGLDWFFDPKTGLRAPSSEFAFDIQHRDEAGVGNIKYVWEPSRHNHVTVLATAYYLTGDERYAERVAADLVSWWQQNPFLTGVHWTSGIEVGLRLIAWTWARRLLNGWPQVKKLFDDNELFHKQLYRHQFYLANLTSHGSSANNHVIYECAGLFISACAYPWFETSGSFREYAANVLKRELELQTFDDGLNREQAGEYHGFVLEAVIAAGIEGQASNHSLGNRYWWAVRNMCDAMAAVVDCKCVMPRQGDGDDGIGLLLDQADYDHVGSLLRTGERLFGRMPWWPQIGAADVRTDIWTALASNVQVEGPARPEQRPDLFADAGLAILRDAAGRADEIWCRCDHGPHGYLSIAGHAHADALSVELRRGGVEIFADPGTYCYHGEPKWRTYFRSTRAHNTLEVAGRDQSEQAGPFMWRKPAAATLRGYAPAEGKKPAHWHAAHNGYLRLDPPAMHNRKVELRPAAREVVISDWLEGEGDHQVVLSWHLGPQVDCRLEGARAVLEWPGGRAILLLDERLRWGWERGDAERPGGWYSPRFDVKIPSFSLHGQGVLRNGEVLVTKVTFES